VHHGREATASAGARWRRRPASEASPPRPGASGAPGDPRSPLARRTRTDSGRLPARARGVEEAARVDRAAAVGHQAARAAGAGAAAGPTARLAPARRRPGERVMSLVGTAWAPIGPSPISQGPNAVNGLVSAIAVNQANANIIYIGTAGGGAWRSSHLYGIDTHCCQYGKGSLNCGGRIL